MDCTFSYPRRVTFADTDMAGFAHFTSLLRWVEEAEAESHRTRGESLCRVDGHGVVTGWPKTSVRIDYTSPLRFDDRVEIRLTPGGRGRTSIVWAFEVVKLPDGTPVASGEMRVVYAAISPGGAITPLPLPATLADA